MSLEIPSSTSHSKARHELLRVDAVLLLLVVAFLTPELACAQTLWTAGTSNWNTAGNWTLGVPNAASGTAFDAVIANGGTAQLLTPPSGSVRRLRVGLAAGGGNLLVDASTLNVTENLHLNETSAAPASVTVQNGSTVTSPSTIVGYSSAFPTNFLITGAGTTYHATTQFLVGNTGAGTPSLTVENGGWLDSAASYIGNSGTATVRNPNSKWSSTGVFTVGNIGVGTLTIQDQGLVSVGTTFTINGGSIVNLSGGTLRFANYSRQPTGVLNFTAGNVQLSGNRSINFDGAVTDIFGASPTITGTRKLTVEGTATIGDSGGAFMAVNGGAFTTQGGMVIGDVFKDVGTLNITGGGTVTNAGATLGFYEDSSGYTSGTVNVSGAGSNWTTGTLVVGDDGVGALNISNGASVVSSDVYMGLGFDGDTIDNTALVSGAGSSWTSTATLRVGGLSSSSLTVQDQALVFVNNELSIGAFSAVNLDRDTFASTAFFVLTMG